jgi:pantetheine-phosphate adenylyltransferase
MANVALGGTFDILHDGHKVLIKKAYDLGDVVIGLTSDEMAREKGHFIHNYKARKQAITTFVRGEIRLEPVIITLDDPYGPSIREQFDYIVVSPETLNTAKRINDVRKKCDLLPITIVVVDWVLAQDGKPISSTRIYRGEIDEHGVLL